MKSFISLLALLYFVIPVCHTQNFEGVQITSEHVRDNIHVLFGMGGNIGVLKGEDGFLIVDDQFEPLTDKIKNVLSGIGDGNVEYAINTHFHFDHADGNKGFGKTGTTILAHTNTRDRLMKDILVEVPGYDTILQEKYPIEALPSLTFSNSMKMHFNDQTVRIFHVKNAHTDSDAVIHFEESNVFHTGDVFVRYGIPFIDRPNGGSVTGMIAATNSLIDLCDEETLIIPGHGQISKKADLVAFRDMLQEIWERVEQQSSEGKSLSEIIESRPARGFTGEENGDYIIIMIYKEMQ